MGTILATLIETKAQTDFWRVLGMRGVRSSSSAVPPAALVDCGLDFKAPLSLAEDLSRDLATKTIGIVAQTTASVMVLHAFHNGAATRRIGHDDEAGWTLEGDAQPWETALFFDEICRDSGVHDAPWPSVLSDSIAQKDIERYWEAKATGDPTRVLDLIRPDHLSPIYRLCAFYGLDAAAPTAHWKKPSLLGRLFRR